MGRQIATIVIFLSFLTIATGANFTCHNGFLCDCFPTGDGVECADVTIKLSSNPKKLEVTIECSFEDGNWNFEKFPVAQIGPVKKIKFMFCPLQEFVIENVLRHLGITLDETLMFNYGNGNTNVSLRAAHLKGVESIERLYLNNNNITSVDKRVFANMSRLRLLDLNSNFIEVYKGMFEFTPNLVSLDLSRNKIPSVDFDLLWDVPKLEVLHLWANNLMELSGNVFEKLTNLKSVDLMKNELSLLEAELFASLEDLEEVNLSLNRLRALPVGLFENNKKLQRIRLNHNLLATLPHALFGALPALKVINLSNCKLISLPDDLFIGTENVSKIELQGNRLSKLSSKTFESMGRLTELDLSQNEISLVVEDVFQHLTNLEKLFLNGNYIKKLDAYALKGLGKLKELRMNKNGLSRIGNSLSGLGELQLLDLSHNELYFDYLNASVIIGINLEQINLRNNSIDVIQESWMSALVNLRVLDLSYNRIRKVKMSDFTRVTKFEMTLDLSHNSIEIVDFKDVPWIINFNNYTTGLSVNLEGNPLSCNCSAFELSKYFRKMLDERVYELANLKARDVFCKEPKRLDGMRVDEIEPNVLTCVEADYCPSRCSCAIRPWDNAYIVDCSHLNLTAVPKLKKVVKTGLIKHNLTEVHLECNKLTRGPTEDLGYENVTTLHLFNNHIKELSWIPSGIKILDLHDNRLSNISYEVLEMLNRTKSLQNISLHDNPWECDCNAVNLSNFLREHLVLKQVNTNKITCRNSDRLLVNLNASDLCKTYTVLMLSAGISLIFVLFIISALFALYYKYEYELKVWLYAHKMMLWWVTEEEIDKNKTYDAFISFSSKDEKFVEKLITILEAEPKPYKICLHTRNWIPGEFISKQIARSVEESRRTLVILSPNFLESVWGKMEFRTAHTTALKEGRARVIIVIYEEVDLEGDLDEELKAYLKTNTYIKWGDPWFWYKLKYALPHSPLKSDAANKRLSNLVAHLNKMESSAVVNTENISGEPPEDPLLLREVPKFRESHVL